MTIYDNYNHPDNWMTSEEVEALQRKERCCNTTETIYDNQTNKKVCFHCGQPKE